MHCTYLCHLYYSNKDTSWTNNTHQQLVYLYTETMKSLFLVLSQIGLAVSLVETVHIGDQTWHCCLTISICTMSDWHSFIPYWCTVHVSLTQFYIECVASVSIEVEIDQQYTTMVRRAACPIEQIKCSKIVHVQVSYDSFHKHYLGWNVCDGKAKIYSFCWYYAKFIICSLEID